MAENSYPKLMETVQNVVIDVTQMPAEHGLLLLAANPQLYPN